MTRKLTKREVEILDLLVLGKTNREIGRAIDWSEEAVKVQANKIFKKYGVRNRVELVLACQKEPYDRYRAPRLA